MTAYEKALQELSQATIATFLAERKRLAAELRETGEKGDAARLELRRKPTASVWAVNQVYWHARAEFDAMMSAAASLRKGDVAASRAYRAALAGLHKRAAGILKKAALGASDATLRRVSTTLAAIAAAGGWEPNPPGALAADLDPPGFEAAGVPAATAMRESRPAATAGEAAARVAPHEKPAPHRTRSRDAARAAEAEERERRREERERERADRAETKRRERELERRTAARAALQRALHVATVEVRSRERALASLDKEREKADQAASAARENAADLERKLAELDDET